MPKYWCKEGQALLDEIRSTRVPDGGVAIWFLGQESMVLKHQETIIYIDPYFTDLRRSDGSSAREYPPPFAPGEVADVHWVFCTHHHLDHLDPGTVGPMAQAAPQARFVAPAPHVPMLTGAGIAPQRVLGARAGEALDCGSFTVVPVAAAHEEFETDEHGQHLFLGYVFRLGPVTVYHAGDTVEYPELVETLRGLNIDVACLPINGRDWHRRRRNILGNLNPREAVDVAANAGVDLVIPLHYDLFKGNQENPATFVDYLYRTYPSLKFKIMAPGERFFYIK